MIQGQQNSYYPIQFGHSQAMIPDPSPSYIWTSSNIRPKSMEAKSTTNKFLNTARILCGKQQSTRKQQTRQLSINFNDKQRKNHDNHWRK
jgi:hypothetical protein